MAYLIHDIENVPPDQFESYFFDANSWIIAIKLSYHSQEHPYEKKYADFFDAVINAASLVDPKLIRKLKHKPNISITSMLMSELINAYMRKIAMRMWFGGGQVYKTKNFKEDYRLKEDSDYSKQLKILVNDIISYKDFTTVVDDDFKKIDPFTFIGNLSNTCDFNDLYYYYRFVELKNTCIVTDDADFLFQDIPIITGNPKLLKHSDIK